MYYYYYFNNETFQNNIDLINNNSFLLHDEILKRLGSTPLYDTLFLFVFPPLALTSLTLNLISYRLFSTPYFTKKPLYTFLRASCLNSALINLIFAFAFLCDSRRYVTLANTQIASYFRVYIKISIANLCYFFGSALDIVLALERLLELTTKFRHIFRQLKPLKLCAYLLVTCFLLNMPYLFVFEPKQLNEVIVTPTRNNNTLFGVLLVYHYGETEFALSRVGKVIKNFQYFVRDILTLVLLFGINLTALVLFRRNFNDDQKSSSEQGDESSIKLKTINNENPSRRRVTLRPNLRIAVNKANSMLTKMVFVICFFATFEHIFLVVSLQFFNVASMERIKVDIIFLANVSMLLKHSINFFIFFCYNRMFRKRFVRRVLRLKFNSTDS